MLVSLCIYIYFQPIIQKKQGTLRTCSALVMYIVIRASDLCSTSCELNSQLCHARLVLRWVTVYMGGKTILVCN